ncbi:MAG: hypothetical protein A3I66_11680 [Burkholderiales bacterium RIFCSPLOWO2_02_FULL_57_36]|nr:MAG: hypothetical protein A3I66_11680 [Burkholderiales bacterium RIFCSPLOWO2_02_FULL_57_36]
MEDKQARAPDAEPGLIAGVVGIAKNGFGLLVSRLELAALELAEVRGNLVKIILVVALGMVTAWFAIAYWTVLVVMLSWQSMGWKILLIFAAVFTVLTIGVFLYAQSIIRQGKLSMRSTMAELRSDRDHLMSGEQGGPTT